MQTDILIVEDSPTQAAQIEEALRVQGYETQTAANGSLALEAVRRRRPALIISDIRMPVMDGFQLCRVVKQDPDLRRIPVILLTSLSTPADVLSALEAGADFHIPKPYQGDYLAAKITEVLLRQSEGGRAIAETVEPVTFGGTTYQISASREQILRLLLSTYEVAIQQNRELLSVREELQSQNVILDEKVRERTAGLVAEMAERRRADEALRESEVRFRSLVEAAPDAIFVESGGRFVYLNPAMLRLLGDSKIEDILGTELMKRIAPEYREVVRERVRLQRETGKPSPLMDQEYLRLDGSRVQTETTAVPIRFQGLDAHLVFARDTAERKRLEEQLRQAQKMEAIGQLAGGVAHDFNNMLFVINGRAGMAMNGLKADDPLRTQLQLIHETGERAANLTRQLLAFSRRQTLQPKILSLNSAVTDMSKMLFRLIREDITMKMVLYPALRPTKADPGQVEQVLMNLVVNARDAMPGNGTLTIETANVELDEAYCRTHADANPGRYVMLAVSDTGCGMDDIVKARIFEPFFTTKEQGKGTGLGLATVYGIVKQSNGHIAVYSEVGKGTTFKIYLPETAAALARDSQVIAAVVPHGTETILLVEDEDDVRILTAEILESVGYKVLLAGDGVEALAAFDRCKDTIGLIITDVVMPKMNGPEMAQQARGLRPGIKVLFISGYTAGAVSSNGLLPPGTNYLQKPCTPGTLARKVREVLDCAAGTAAAKR